MNVGTDNSRGDQDPTQAQFAEAAAWVARLHGPNHTLQVERGFRRWLSANPAHGAAFEAMTTAWELTAGLPKEPFPHLSRWQRAGYREGLIRSGLASAAIVALACGSFFYLGRNEAIDTGIGEQRTLGLEDGTRVTLNTNTRVIVDYDEQQRSIELKGGEAIFEVAKHTNWPFVVKAGDRQVRAVGTEFVVRRDADELEVTLVEGKVAVEPVKMPVLGISAARREPRAHTDRAEKPGAVAYLSPGQRLTFAADHPPKLDRPALDKITAWRRGLVDFEDTPLTEAVAEMNRYSSLKLIVENPKVAAIPITGVFRAGDASSFAAAVARAYQLKVIEEDDEILMLVSMAPEFN